jgi:hypothetical protein
MRDLLLAIASRRPGHRPEWPGLNGSAAHVAASAEHSEQAGTSYAPEPVADTPREARDDILGASLAFGVPGDGDEHAAHVLARAFRQNGHAEGPPLIAGEPARAAADELSLRTVFKSTEAAPPPSSFSFDQFFSQRASAEHPASSAGQGQAAESPEDVAQFTQWLEGLKKR